jgi:hypothetical protein
MSAGMQPNPWEREEPVGPSIVPPKEQARMPYRESREPGEDDDVD